MVTEHSYIYAWLDGQLSEVFSNNVDTLDQLLDDYSAVLDFIQSNMTFVNLDRSCLIGGNIGASLVMITLSSVSSIRCGIAIAPVIEWRSISKFTMIVDFVVTM